MTQTGMKENVPQKPNDVIQIDETRIQHHLGELVRDTVEETLNQLLDAEAEQLCNAVRYKRTEARRDTGAGHYQRKLQISQFKRLELLLCAGLGATC